MVHVPVHAEIKTPSVVENLSPSTLDVVTFDPSGTKVLEVLKMSPIYPTTLEVVMKV